jgi:hypothetical protein
VRAGWPGSGRRATGNRQHQSILRAVIGSRRMARSAGTRIAKTPTRSSKPVTPANVSGSSAGTPKSHVPG